MSASICQSPWGYISGGAEEKNSRERRFLGWFMFDNTLPSGEKPAELAAKRLYTAGMQDELLKAIAGTRYVNAVVSGVIGRRVFLGRSC